MEDEYPLAKVFCITFHQMSAKVLARCLSTRYSQLHNRRSHQETSGEVKLQSPQLPHTSSSEENRFQKAHGVLLNGPDQSIPISPFSLSPGEQVDSTMQAEIAYDSPTAFSSIHADAVNIMSPNNEKLGFIIPGLTSTQDLGVMRSDPNACDTAMKFGNDQALMSQALLTESPSSELLDDLLDSIPVDWTGYESSLNGSAANICIT